MSTITLSTDEQRYLGTVARLAILRKWRESEGEIPPPDQTSVLSAELGAFVTLTRNGHLRGCIGNMIGQGPLYRTIERMACAAAFEDPRFPPLRADEWPDVTLDISILGPLTLCPDPDCIKIGQHGLLLVLGNQSGVFLPQVPVEQHWNRETYLQQLCGKAGLPAGSWKTPGAALYWYEAFVFSPDENED